LREISRFLGSVWAKTGFIRFSCFIVGTGTALFFWPLIHLPFSNPFHVVGPCALAGFNPQTDVCRMGLFLLAPAVCWFLILPFAAKRANFPPGSDPAPFHGGPWLVAALLVYAFLLAVNVPTYHSFGRFDAYHEGESLGSALSLEAGQVPYRDFLFFHGWFQDPGRAVLAFHFFGRSIGAVRCLESLCKGLTWMFLALLLRAIWPSKPSRAFLSLSVLALFQVGFAFNVFFENFILHPSPDAATDLFVRFQSFLKPMELLIVPPRDLVPLAYGGLLLALWRNWLRPERDRGIFWTLVFGFSFLPFLSMVCSVDRGYCLFTVGLVAAFFLRGMGMPPNINPVKLLITVVLGAVAGIGLWGWLLRWDFGDFFTYVFWVLPRTKELSDKNGPYPIGDPAFLIAALAMAGVVFTEILRFCDADGKAAYFRGAFPSAILGLWSLLYFRGALARPDWEHILYGLDVFWIWVFSRFFEWKDRRFRLGRTAGGTLVLCVLLAGLGAVHFIRWDGTRQNFPWNVPDQSYLNGEQKTVVEFLSSRLKPGETFFTLTSEASWYYLLNRPCPTPFPYLWTAAPEAFQRREVESLEQAKVRYVIYRDGDWSESIDGIPNEARFPVLSAYLRDHYAPWETLGRCEIWRLKKKS
jgi:hypothetical protein